MIETFIKYINDNYNLRNKDIRLKLNHSLRVMKLQAYYASMKGFSEEEIEIAKIIGLLHDIGRFKQLKEYKTYSDINSIDHGDYAIKILFEDNLIDLFNIDKKWYKVISFSIKNHNKYEIEKCNDKKLLKQAMLIRDTDKLDIAYLVWIIKDIKLKIPKDNLSSEVIKEIKNHKIVDKSKISTMADKYIVKYALAFDINDKDILKEFYNYMVHSKVSIKKNKDLLEAYKIVEDYIKKECVF